MSEELLEQAVVIRDETVNEANTAERIGKLFVDIIRKMAKNLNADAVTFKGTATGVNMVFSGEDGDVLISLPVVGTEEAGVITPEMLAGIGDAIAAERARAEEFELNSTKAVAALAGRVTAIENGYATDVELYKEQTRAEAAEKANADAIVAERDRAVAAEQANAQAITTNNQIIVTQGKSISALIAQNGSLKLTVTPNVVLRNEQTDVTVEAVFGSTLEPDATAEIKILKDAEVVAKEDGIKELSLSESLVAGADVAYSAETVYSEKTLTAAQKLSVVDPVFVGTSASNVAATARTDVAVDAYKQTARTSAAGTYTVTVANDGDYVWLLVPRGFAAIKKATLSGLDFPLETPTVVYIGGSSALTGGIPYSCYRSSNQYAAGNLSIVIS